MIPKPFHAALTQLSRRGAALPDVALMAAGHACAPEAGAQAMSKAADQAIPQRRRGRLFLLWAALAALVLPFAADFEARLDARARVDGSESFRTEAMLAREFDTPLADPLILIIEGLNPARGQAEADLLAGLLERLRAAEPRLRTVSYVDTGDALFIGADSASTIVLIDAPPSAREHGPLVGRLHQAADDYLASRSASLSLHWTSESLINDELRELSARDAAEAELRVLPLALIVLLIAFGSATAGVTPVAIGFLTVALARGLLALVDGVLPLSVLTANVTTMLGLGLAVDYALLVVSRFREELDRGGAQAAAAAAARRAGAAVALSGLGVAIALSALLVVPINEVRSIGLAGLVVVAVAVTVCATLLPALLSIVGSRIDVLLPLRRRLAPTANRFWENWAKIVFARPLLLTALAAAPLLALALNCARLDISLPRGEWLPSSARAAVAMTALDRVGRTGFLQTIHVTARLEAPVSAPAGWSAVSELVQRYRADPRVEAARSVSSAAGRDGWRLYRSLPASVQRMFVSDDERTALIAVVPRADLELHELSQLVRDLRGGSSAPGVAALSIGGTPALTADYVDAVARWFTPVAALILGATLLVLMIGLRSVLLPLKAVALNLFSVAAALGAMTLVFQDGAGAGLLGLSGPAGAVFPIIPILVFSIVFGLSMDYEVFLFSRVVEARRAGASDLDAMTIGLRATAGVITSAAALMIIVFGAFVLGDFLLMKMLGFSLAAAILIDAVLVRLVLGPALFAIAGRWNWWPFGWSGRIDAAPATS
jgi:RND superfamily putative drug exporter